MGEVGIESISKRELMAISSETSAQSLVTSTPHLHEHLCRLLPLGCGLRGPVPMTRCCGGDAVCRCVVPATTVLA